MFKYSFVLVFILNFSFSYAQGIEFFKGSWEEVTIKAKAEKKQIFVDVYTDWCGPCKKLDVTTFKDEELGAFFNEHFIAFKIEAEKSPDKSLAYAFGIGGYPVMIFLDENGIQKIQARGFKHPEALLAIGAYALKLNVSKEFETLVKSDPSQLSKDELSTIFTKFKEFHSLKKTSWMSLLHNQWSEQEREENKYAMIAQFPFLSEGLKDHYIQRYSRPDFGRMDRKQIIIDQYNIGKELEYEYEEAFKIKDLENFHLKMERRLTFGLKCGQLSKDQVGSLRESYLHEFKAEYDMIK